MKVKVLAIEVFETQGGKEHLSDVVILGDEDAYDREVGVTYEGTTDIAELKEVLKGYAESTRINLIGRAVEKGNLYFQCEAKHLPRKIGATRIEMVTREVEWPVAVKEPK